MIVYLRFICLLIAIHCLKKEKSNSEHCWKSNDVLKLKYSMIMRLHYKKLILNLMLLLFVILVESTMKVYGTFMNNFKIFAIPGVKEAIWS